MREWLGAVIAGQAAMLRNHSTKRGALGPVKPTGGRLGLPADFLIAPDGRITALKYGRHAYDQWTVDELLDHARPVSALPLCASPRPRSLRPARSSGR